MPIHSFTLALAASIPSAPAPASPSAAAPAAAQCAGPAWQAGQGFAGVGQRQGLPGGSTGTIVAALDWDPDGPGPRPTGVVAAGPFSFAGASLAQGVAFFDGSHWSPLGSGVGVAGSISVLAILPDRRLVVGGSFVSIDDTPADNVAVFDGLTWAALGSGTDGPVTALATDGNGTLVAGGQFTRVGALPANGLARFDGSQWSPIGAGVQSDLGATGSGIVHDLARDTNGDLVLSGSFELAGGVRAHNVARLSLRPAPVAPRWAPLGAGLDGALVEVEVLANGDVVCAGFVTLADGTPVGNIARWDGAAWQGLGAGLPDPVRDLVIEPSGGLVAVGDFASPGSPTLAGIARWDGATWSPIGDLTASLAYPDFVQHYAVCNTPTGLFLGGEVRGGAAVWDGQRWSNAGHGFDASVWALAVDRAGFVYAGGAFGQAFEVEARDVARFDGAGFVALGQGPGFPTFALAADSSSEVVAAGYVAGPAGSVPRVARWDGSAWVTLGAGVSLSDVVVPAPGEVVGTGHGAAGLGVYRWTGAAWSRVGGQFGDAVFEPIVWSLLALPNGELVAAGRFDSIAGVPVRNIARWDGLAWSALGVGLGLAGEFVADLALAPNGDIVAAGQFTLPTGGGVVTAHVARWNGTTWSPLLGGVTVGGGVGGDARLCAVLPDGRVVAAGDFNGRIAVHDGAAWSFFAGRVDGPPLAIVALPSGELALGGEFRGLADLVSARFAWFGCDTVGQNYCTATPNSTGAAGTLRGEGSGIAEANRFRLVATELPPGALGLFLTSPFAGLNPNPGGSSGILCLGAPLGRYDSPSAVQFASATGELALDLDLTATPSAGGFVAVLAGETRRFQAWHRDLAAGAATSNFTEALEVTFR